jgi:hypothetical protein
MPTSFGMTTVQTLSEFKAELLAHIEKLRAQNFFASDAAYQKAIDNVESITESQWNDSNRAEPGTVFEKGGIDKLN